MGLYYIIFNHINNIILYFIKNSHELDSLSLSLSPENDVSSERSKVTSIRARILCGPLAPSPAAQGLILQAPGLPKPLRGYCESVLPSHSHHFPGKFIEISYLHKGFSVQAPFLPSPVVLSTVTLFLFSLLCHQYGGDSGDTGHQSLWLLCHIKPYSLTQWDMKLWCLLFVFQLPLPHGVGLFIYKEISLDLS